MLLLLPHFQSIVLAKQLAGQSDSGQFVFNKQTMKIIPIIVILSVFILSSYTSFSQQQGLGIVFNEKPLIGSGMNIADHPTTEIPPVCGKKRRTEGFNLPYPFGVGLHGLWYQQDFTASNLLISDSAGRVTVTADTMYQNTRASDMKLTLRPDFWLLPFLNVYGIFGYTQGKVSPNITVPSFTMHIEGLPDIPIDTTFELKDKLTYHGPTVGGGVTFAMGFGAFFVILDYNYSVTYPDDSDDKLVNHSFSPKVGIQLASKKGAGRGALWLGGMYIGNNQTFNGILNVEEISPIVALILGKEADYSGDIKSNQQWNMVIGGSYFINKHHSLFVEAGFIGRQQISLGYGFRF